MSSCACGTVHHPAASSPVKANYKEMKALTATLNPDTVGRDKELSKVMLFQSLPNGTVGLEQLNFNERDLNPQEYGKVKGYYDEPSALVPTLKEKSNLVSMVYDDLVHVYGVNAQSNSIWLLSPVLMPLKYADVGNLRGKIAGCSNGEKGWLYFQKYDPKGKKFCIYEKSLTSPSENPVLVSKTGDSKENTDLAAFHDGRRRWIAYQTSNTDEDEESSEIQVVCVDDGSANHVVPDSGNYIDNQLVEFAAANAIKNGVNVIFIYFRGQKSKLYRSSAETTGGKVSFSKPQNLTEQTTLVKNASLSVVPNPAKETNVIYAIKAGSERIEAFDDQWA